MAREGYVKINYSLTSDDIFRLPVEESVFANIIQRRPSVKNSRYINVAHNVLLSDNTLINLPENQAPCIVSNAFINSVFKQPRTYLLDLNILSDLLEIFEASMQSEKQLNNLIAGWNYSGNNYRSSLALVLFINLSGDDWNIASIVEKYSRGTFQIDLDDLTVVKSYVAENIVQLFNVLNNPTELRHLSPLTFVARESQKILCSDLIYRDIFWLNTGCCLLKLENLIHSSLEPDPTIIFMEYKKWMFNEHLVDIILLQYAFIRLHCKINVIHYNEFKDQSIDNLISNAIWDLYYLRAVVQLYRYQNLMTFHGMAFMQYCIDIGMPKRPGPIFITNDSKLAYLYFALSDPSYIDSYINKEKKKPNPKLGSKFKKLNLKFMDIYKESEDIEFKGHDPKNPRFFHKNKYLNNKHLFHIYTQELNRFMLNNANKSM